jgi:hypothetical protein
MKKIVKELAKEAGFAFWENEEWKPKGATIDWSCDYEKELEKFAERIVQECASIIESQDVDPTFRHRMSWAMKEKFGVEK